MKKIKIFLAVVFLISSICLILSESIIAAPVTLEETRFHVTILKEGKLEVHYQLTFTEHQTRDRIKKIGQFFEPIQFIQSYGTHGKKKFNVTMEGLGGNYYSAKFNITTKTSNKYTIHMRYLVNKSVLEKIKIKGKTYGYFFWTPIQWGLPIKKQIVQIILPIEIARKYRKAEQVDQKLVDSLGIVTGRDTSSHSRWISAKTQRKRLTKP